MKVKYINKKVKYINKKEELGLEYGKIYNVFAIQLGKNKWKKFYIKAKGPRYIYPIDISDFEIIDNRLSKFWTFGICSFGDYYIGPEELYNFRKYFWEDYYNDDKECLAVIDKYFKIARDELFNE